MPFQIILDDINRISCDAIVETYLDHRNETEAKIYPVPNDLFDQCDEIETISASEFSLIRAARKNCKYTIHTPIPHNASSIYDPEILRYCYKSALQIVQDFGLNKVAFPLIGSDKEEAFKERALQIALEEISRFIKENEDVTILLVIRSKRNFCPNPKLLSGVSDYIRYVKQIEQRVQQQEMMLDLASTGAFPAITSEEIEAARRENETSPFPLPQEPTASAPKASKMAGFSWIKRRKNNVLPTSSDSDEETSGIVVPFSSFKPQQEVVLDESFSQMVLRKIDENGYERDSDCYCKANIDRRLFSRIRCDENYHPKKTTAVALAIALELPLNETNELLMKAGYSLSHSILFDVIVEYCILQKNYDIFEINELLFQYDQPLLGG